METWTPRRPSRPRPPDATSGRCGATSWADLAVATWSTVWNYRPGWEETLLGAYGVARDPRRVAFYRDLWEVTP